MKNPTAEKNLPTTVPSQVMEEIIKTLIINLKNQTKLQEDAKSRQQKSINAITTETIPVEDEIAEVIAEIETAKRDEQRLEAEYNLPDITEPQKAAVRKALVRIRENIESLKDWNANISTSIKQDSLNPNSSKIDQEKDGKEQKKLNVAPSSSSSTSGSLATSTVMPMEGTLSDVKPQSNGTSRISTNIFTVTNSASSPVNQTSSPSNTTPAIQKKNGKPFNLNRGIHNLGLVLGSKYPDKRKKAGRELAKNLSSLLTPSGR